MNVIDAINARRAYRSLTPVVVTEDLIRDLAECGRLAPSCFNHQPWRFVFVYDPGQLSKMQSAFSRGNEWMRRASLIIVVFTRPDLDCRMKDGREYYYFDTGMAVANMILRATELGLVAHPVAGYDPARIREILEIPADMRVITLVNVGRHAADLNPELSEKQLEDEKRRPPRLPLANFVYHNRYETPSA